MRCSSGAVSHLAAIAALSGLMLQAGGAQPSSLPVIPGAQGYGMTTRAAYGGPVAPTVYRVTNLHDAGEGSLRAALTASSPRVVIFEISGTIGLDSDIYVKTPYLTVAGQTAPSPGITIKNHGLYVGATDVLLQHFRIRPGSTTCNSGLQVYGGDQHNIIIDHMSFSWGQDENLAFNWTNGQSTDATVWRSIVSEGLYRAAGADKCPGGGASNGHGILISAESGRVAVIQSLFANNFERNPYMQGGTQVALLNNLVYQWHGPWGFFFNNGGVCMECRGKPWAASVVGNRFIKGPRTTDRTDAVAYTFLYSTNNQIGNLRGNKIYRRDNTVANPDRTVDLETNQYSYNPNVTAPPVEAPIPIGFTPLASTGVESFVLANAGSRPADRDAVDARIVREVRERKGTFISDPTAVGGYPALAINSRPLVMPKNPHIVTASGYTNLEVWLHGYAVAVEGGANPPDRR
jgi:hypothetical protein